VQDLIECSAPLGRRQKASAQKRCMSPAIMTVIRNPLLQQAHDRDISTERNFYAGIMLLAEEGLVCAEHR